VARISITQTQVALQQLIHLHLGQSFETYQTRYVKAKMLTRNCQGNTCSALVSITIGLRLPGITKTSALNAFPHLG
jgi:hypothetical protein